MIHFFQSVVEYRKNTIECNYVILLCSIAHFKVRWLTRIWKPTLFNFESFNSESTSNNPPINLKKVQKNKHAVWNTNSLSPLYAMWKN